MDTLAVDPNGLMVGGGVEIDGDVAAGAMAELSERLAEGLGRGALPEAQRGRQGERDIVQHRTVGSHGSQEHDVPPGCSSQLRELVEVSIGFSGEGISVSQTW